MSTGTIAAAWLKALRPEWRVLYARGCCVESCQGNCAKRAVGCFYGRKK